MSAYLNLRLTGREADAVLTVLAVVLNDPDWFADDQSEGRAVARAQDKLINAINGAIK